MLWRPNGRELHSTPFKWSKDQLEYHGSLFISIMSCCEDSPQFGVSYALHDLISDEHKSNGVETEREMGLTISYNQFWCLTSITNHID
jgi:hypothetical protein